MGESTSAAVGSTVESAGAEATEGGQSSAPVSSDNGFTNAAGSTEPSAKVDSVKGDSKTEDSGQADSGQIGATSKENADAPPGDDAAKKGEEVPFSLSDFSKKQLAAIYEGEEFSDDESVSKGLERFVGEHNELKTTHEKNIKNNQILTKLIKSDPAFASMLSDMRENDTPYAVAYARHIGDSPAIGEGEDGYDDWVSEQKASKDKALQRQQKEAEFKDKMKKSTDNMRNWLTKQYGEGDETQESKQKFVEFFDNLIFSAASGDITDDSLNQVLQAFNYQADLQKATEAGEAQGKNKEINKKFEKHKKDSEANPLPNITSIGDPEHQEGEKDPILTLKPKTKFEL